VYNTRIAPSPSGDMHLGTARTAYFNWLAARATGGKFLLRIDDTNADKSHPEYTQVILDTMAWLGLDYDKLDYQSRGFDRYQTIANELVEQGKARVLENGAIALCPIDVPNSFKDEVGGDIPISLNDKDYIAGRGSDGVILMRAPVNGVAAPTYHFACVVDDIVHDINYIIRGVDHITNTSRQIAIYTALGEPIPKYAHVGLIHFQGKKLSKRDGAASMLTYRDKGYHPEAMLNFMARLGWGPNVDDKTTKLLPRQRMLELFFEGGHMRSPSSGMDFAKLDSFDRKYKAMK
jgi:glutamyl-tRNA synthetase